MYGGLRHAAQRLIHPSRRVILMYHRVAEPDLDPWELAVTPDHLAEHLTVLRRLTEPIPLDAMLSGSRRHGRPWATVTFDDGYVDTLTAAVEPLDEHGLTATVFVSTAGIDGNPVCWWDELAEVFLRPGRLPRQLRILIGHETCAWDLAGDRDYSIGQARRHLPWCAGDPAPTVRHAAYVDVWRRVIGQPHAEQRRVLAELRQWADRATTPRARLMTADEVVRLSRHPAIVIGGHTVNHLTLPAIDDRTRVTEIGCNRQQLRELTGQAVEHFAYPFGRYSTEAVSAVADIGFRAAFTTDHRPVPGNCDRMTVPRLHVPDLDGHSFERWLHGHLA